MTRVVGDDVDSAVASDETTMTGRMEIAMEIKKEGMIDEKREVHIKLTVYSNIISILILAFFTNMLQVL